MEISEIKQRLDIIDVARKLGINVDERTKKAKCPFHPDKTPSLQFSREKQICTCFSSNCDAGTMDIIGLVEKYNKCTKHEAIEWLKEMAGATNPVKPEPAKKEETPDYAEDFELMRGSFLSSSVARKYVEDRALNRDFLQIGYNAFKNSRFPYLRGCVVFALKNSNGKTVSLYGRSVRDNDKAKHYYTRDRKGLYPSWPKEDAKKLILAESIVDAATLLSVKEIKDKYTVLAMYGTNGITEDHLKAVKELRQLNEIIFFLDGDDAGRESVKKWGEVLSKLPKIKISVAECPEGQDVNSLVMEHGGKMLVKLLNKKMLFAVSHGRQIKEEPENVAVEKSAPSVESAGNPVLDTKKENKAIFIGEAAKYEIRGSIPKTYDSLRVTVEIDPKNGEADIKRRKLWSRIELYDYKATEKFARDASDKLGLRADLIEGDLSVMTELIDKYRQEREEELKKRKSEPEERLLTADEKNKYISFGKKKDLFEALNELVGKSGLVGEENSRMFLLMIAVSHLMPKPLHAVVQGGSGSGKSHLIKQISLLVPQSKVKRYTRLSEKSFYNFGEFDLCNTLIIIEDYDGMNEDVEYAFREIQSGGELRSAVSAKENELSDNKTVDKVVRGPIASIVATTKCEIYHDNSTRVFFISVDESEEQTRRIIDYKNKKASGSITGQDEEQAREFMRGFVKTLKPYEVKNPYLQHINLPVPHDQLRRLHELLEAFCCQVVLVRQHQRNKTKDGKLIAEKEDMGTAIDLMFESIVLKADELDGRLRQFYEKLKEYVGKKGINYEFTQREIRHELLVSKSQLSRYMIDLEALEYIYKRGQVARGAMSYRINYWDDNEATRARIKSTLHEQLGKL